MNLAWLAFFFLCLQIHGICDLKPRKVHIIGSSLQTLLITCVSPFYACQWQLLFNVPNSSVYLVLHFQCLVGEGSGLGVCVGAFYWEVVGLTPAADISFFGRTKHSVLTGACKLRRHPKVKNCFLAMLPGALEGLNKHWLVGEMCYSSKPLFLPQAFLIPSQFFVPRLSFSCRWRSCLTIDEHRYRRCGHVSFRPHQNLNGRTVVVHRMQRNVWMETGLMDRTKEW